MAALSLMNATSWGLAQYFDCFTDPICYELWLLVSYLGSDAAGFANWSADLLVQAFSTYPHEPKPAGPEDIAASLFVSNSPIVGDLYDLWTGITGYDPITGQYLTGFERLVTLIGVLPILGVAGANLRYADEFIDTGDSLARYIGKACSFDEETPVTTEDGAIPIKDVDVGDKVLAWDEATDSTGYFLVTATWAHEDPVTVLLTVDGETIETTLDHPFLTADDTWVTAGELAVGDTLRSADGDVGVVNAVEFVAAPQLMYNMTVADAHTYVVGDGEWVVHNACGSASARDFVLTHGISGKASTKQVIGLAQEMQVNGFTNIPAIKVIVQDGKLFIVDGHHRVAAARLARANVPYEIVDETWLAANTGWSSITDVIKDSLQFISFNLDQHLLKKAGFR